MLPGRPKRAAFRHLLLIKYAERNNEIELTDGRTNFVGSTLAYLAPIYAIDLPDND